VAARTVSEVAFVIGALVVVVAWVTCAEVLYADAVYTDTGKTIEVAFLPVVQQNPNVGASTAQRVTRVVRAFVLVVAVLVFQALETFIPAPDHSQRP